MDNIEKSVLKTLAFFDIFSYPLTLSELWKWLYNPGQKVTLAELKDVLDNSKVLQKKICQQEGFYSLVGREHIYLRRKQNNNLAERKFRRAVLLSKIYRFIPFVRMIAVCNSLAYSNAGENSDIDLFIITKRGTIWLARFFTIILVSLLRLRPKEDNKRDAFCLSFFISEDALDISSSMMSRDDIYYPYWVSQLLPIYNPDGLYEKFLAANSWYLEQLPHSYKNHFSKEIKETRLTKAGSKIISFIASPPLFRRSFYNFYRSFQVRIIGHNLGSLVNLDTRVIVNEGMLKFYPNDNRELFYKKWKDRVYNLLDNIDNQ